MEVRVVLASSIRHTLALNQVNSSIGPGVTNPWVVDTKQKSKSLYQHLSKPLFPPSHLCVHAVCHRVTLQRFIPLIAPNASTH